MLNENMCFDLYQVARQMIHKTDIKLYVQQQGQPANPLKDNFEGSFIILPIIRRQKVK
jgi:hypothetical protein